MSAKGTVRPSERPMTLRDPIRQCGYIGVQITHMSRTTSGSTSVRSSSPLSSLQQTPLLALHRAASGALAFVEDSSGQTGGFVPSLEPSRAGRRTERAAPWASCGIVGAADMDGAGG